MINENLQPRRVSDSKTSLVDLVLPPDTNHHSTIFGGKVMAYADKLAAIAAMRHCRREVVTVNSDSFRFHAPIKTGEAICVDAKVVCAHRTTMEVFVEIHSENLLTGEKKLTSNAYITMLALGDDGKPTRVPEVIPETAEEKKQYEYAMERYKALKVKK